MVAAPLRLPCRVFLFGYLCNLSSSRIPKSVYQEGEAGTAGFFDKDTGPNDHDALEELGVPSVECDKEQPQVLCRVA